MRFSPNGCHRRIRASLAAGLVTLGLLAWLATPPTVRAEEAADSTGSGGQEWKGRRTFQSPAGTRIDVSTNQPNLTDDEILAALEEAARQMRGRIKPNSHRADTEESKGEPPAVSHGSTPQALVTQGVISFDPAPPLPAAEPPPPPCSCSRTDEKHGFFRHWDCVGLPTGLLWEPPLANPLQPRMAVDVTTLDNENAHGTIDTAIGGEVGILRVHPQCVPGLMIQQDFFAVVLSRWADNSEAVGNDFRFGFPTTFQYGNWQGKLGYEHTSSHLGDDFIKVHNRFKEGHVRDEIVAGLAYRFWDQVRVYGIFGLAAGDLGGQDSDADRYDIGIEWSKAGSTGWRGQPYAACDLEFRADQDYHANITTQLGWQWQRYDGEARATSLRIGVQYYDGKSPFGQFLRDRERFFGGGIWVDF